LATCGRNNYSSRSDRKSLFAPSIRSNFSTFTNNLAKGKNKLSKISHILSTRSASRTRSKREAEIDREIQELQEAVHTKKLLASSTESQPMEILNSSDEVETVQHETTTPATTAAAAAAAAAADLDIPNEPARTLGNQSRTETCRSNVTSVYLDAEDQ
jgi:seryl-tRNA synthetase